MSFGEGEARSTVEATYDVLNDESEIEYLTGGCKSDKKAGDGQKDERQQSDEPNGDKRRSGKGNKNDPEQRGLILLRILTDKGRLKLED